MSIFGERASVPADATPAAWIASRLGPFGTVGGLVPGGFDAYVLVDHATPEEPEGWQASSELLERLSSAAARHTSTPVAAWFAIWEGYGWEGATFVYAVAEDPRSALAAARERRRLRRMDSERSERVRRGLATVPKFDLPNRRYYLLAGSVDAAASIEQPGGLGTQPPDLWWPDDHAWFVATDTDLSWSYVGGSSALVAEVAAVFAGRTRSVEWAAANAAVLR